MAAAVVMTAGDGGGGGGGAASMAVVMVVVWWWHDLLVHGKHGTQKVMVDEEDVRVPQVLLERYCERVRDVHSALWL